MVLRPLKRREEEEEPEFTDDEPKEEDEEEEPQEKSSSSSKSMKPLRDRVDKPIKIVQIPHAYEPAYEFPDGTTLGGQEIILWMANEIYKISKRLND